MSPNVVVLALPLLPLLQPVIGFLPLMIELIGAHLHVVGGLPCHGGSAALTWGERFGPPSARSGTRAIEA